MSFFAKSLWVILCVAAGFMMGLMVDGAEFFSAFIQGRLYAVYVLVYTGGAFIAGLWFGQRWERSWELRMETAETSPGLLREEAGLEGHS